MRRFGSTNLRRLGRSLTGVVCVAALGVQPATARAAERIAVVFSAQAAEDAGLAENLGEIAIASLADSHPGELFGSSEIGRLLQRTRNGESAARCVAQAACLAHLSEQLAIASVVVGTLQREGARITLQFRLLDTLTAQEKRIVSRTSDEKVSEMVAATRDGIAHLLAPASAPEARTPPTSASDPALVTSAAASSTTPMSAGTLTPARSPAIVSPTPAPQAVERDWWTAASYGTGALALLSISAAAVLGTLAQQEPTGATRHEVQSNLERERGFARAANVLWLSGGILAAASIVGFVTTPRRGTAR